MEEKSTAGCGNPPAKEITATIHYAESGPDLDACMAAVLSAHLSKNADP